MKIGLLSDTHGFLDPLLFNYFEECDEIWHAGDFGTMEVAEKLAVFKPLRGVYGNIDDRQIRQGYPLDLLFEEEGVKVYMTHIGGYPGKYDKRALEVIKREQPNLFICGHSHILKVMHDPQLKMLAMNPGAAGKYGWQKVRTALRFELSGGKIQNLEVIELGKRGG